MPMARPTMLASARGELKTRSRAELALQVVGDLEDAALALDLGRGSSSRRAVGHVLAEDHDARVARHLVVQAGVQEVHHRLRVARGVRARVRKASRGRGRRRASRRGACALSGSGAGAARAASAAAFTSRSTSVAQRAAAPPRWRRPRPRGACGEGDEGVAPRVRRRAPRRRGRGPRRRRGSGSRAG